MPRYDYALPGAYFVTICTHGRACLFGAVNDGRMELNGPGKMVACQWLALAERFPGLIVDAFVLMPNHLHGILFLEADTGGGERQRAPGRAALGDIVGAFKSISAMLYRRGTGESRWPPLRESLWQRNYYEHVIRDERALSRLRQYIVDNPAQWSEDHENPAKTPQRGLDSHEAKLRGVIVDGRSR
jgi:REP element-mobilizing transposase RayT